MQMPALVAIHRLKDLDEWMKVFKTNPPPQIGRWRLLRGTDDRNWVHVVAELQESEIKGVKDFIESKRMQNVFRQVKAVSTAPIEFVWLEELTP
jgi:hypothetical protein